MDPYEKAITFDGSDFLSSHGNYNNFIKLYNLK